MGDSNAEWGALASQDNELAEAWDSYARLPEPGENEALDSFCERKRITIASLVRLGARLSDAQVLAFAFPGGLKFRDFVTDRRWSYTGSTWDELKIVRAQSESSTAIVVEGETDGARLSEVYPADVAILPAGARTFKERYAEQLADYEIVLVGLDNDEAGEIGARQIIEQVPAAMRFVPPENDWCATQDDNLPSLPTQVERTEPPLIVSAGDLFELEEPNIASWYESAVLPVGGLMVLHGAAKSFKTFIALDLMGRLAQGEPWAAFEPTEEPCRVVVIQYELTWPYYRQRILQMADHAHDRAALDSHFLTYSPLSRPQLIAGNRKQEDVVLNQLVGAGAQVVLLDPIRRATGTADMNAENEVRKMLAFFERMNNEGITVVATHHDTKQAMRARGGDPLGMTGSGAWFGDPDSIVSVECPSDQDPRTSTKRNLYFTLRNAPSVGGRAFQLHDDGAISYDNELWDSNEDPTAPEI